MYALRAIICLGYLAYVTNIIIPKVLMNVLLCSSSSSSRKGNSLNKPKPHYRAPVSSSADLLVGWLLILISASAGLGSSGANVLCR